ncbi:F-box only protein 40 [Hyla sarda]|uniref:F-box only protein 40 n=1 Tax=Hyla sarda TaxID=327740 RepID=UPI0024C357AE|nr:F-box only protein 40 [Hyla sarda]
MGRTQRPPPGQHPHCQNCFNKRCNAPINTSISCLVISCRLHCGAAFHMCKEEEHLLLCPNEWVPCLNSGFGCPFSMSRCKQAKHLRVCPASVVCCSMDWNRWSTIDKDQTLYKNLLQEEGGEEHLDVALTLRDQEILFSSLKMAKLYPELSEDPKDTITISPSEVEEDGGAVGGSDPENVGNVDVSNGQMVGLSQYEREALARGQGGLDLDKFKRWDTIFSKEMSTNQYLEANIGQTPSNKVPDSSKSPGNEPNTEKSQEPDDGKRSEDARKLEMADLEKTGFAPWQEGVLERLKTEVDCGSYNMYLVHHGSMLIRFGQMAACTPREKDFVYGNLEAQTLKTVYSFKVPTSYCGRRARLADDSHKKVKAEKLVDTSDLGVPVDNLPLTDTIYTTLLVALDRELKGHSVSQMNALDGLLIDFGTQTYDFGAEPFTNKTVLLDLLIEKNMKSLGLYLDIEGECVTSRHNKSNSSFTFSCNLFFRRDEFADHYKNVHSDIQTCLGGWFQQRCPLSYLGCTFVQNRFQAARQRSQVIYSKNMKTFAMKPLVDCALYEGVRPNMSRSHRGKSKDSLSSLPLEVLQHIAGFLDSFSLGQLSQVSSLMRDICASLLQERGMVHLYWEKKTYSHGGTSWRCRKKVWNFSSLFSPVQQWTLADISAMSEHLKVCPYNTPEQKKEPYQLPSLYNQEQKKEESLLTLKRRLRP